MIDIQQIIAAVSEEMGEGGLFLVEVKASGADEFEVFVDSDARDENDRPKGVTVDDCVRLAKAVEARFDRDTDDFSLTVSSAGIGQPLKVARQYGKLVGRSVEVVLKSGVKIVAALDGFEQGAPAKNETGSAGIEKDLETASIALSYEEKQKTEGKKRPELVKVTKTFPLAEIKTTTEHIDFK
ncbi:MAG: ribosome assembly cofactor RimP [Alistipes sp.]|jgi:ribosome maturation factor RimP|nr:ribosome assembly cofactor RimP [Alistipes sp.]